MPTVAAVAVIISVPHDTVVVGGDHIGGSHDDGRRSTNWNGARGRADIERTGFSSGTGEE
jgi:hypothetical protein